MLIDLIKSKIFLYAACFFMIAGLALTAWLSGNNAAKASIAKKSIESVRSKNEISEKLGRIAPNDRRNRLLKWSE